MWYFTWVLGLGLAASFAILNGMWLEMNLGDQGRPAEPGTQRGEPS